MKEKLVGRAKEVEILEKALGSPKAELVAVIGRRRVGKTFLINSVFEGKISFDITGIQDAPLARQLKNFRFSLSERSEKPVPSPKDWFDAFIQLIDFLKSTGGRGKQVVFFDEVPWLATPRSGFLQGFSFFWNSWAVKQEIIVVICGSAASWMIQKVVNNKGGLHNRITKRIHLDPFNLSETETFLKTKGVKLDRYQIIQLYMAMGGIPHYLNEVQSGKSATQNIDEICFAREGILNQEFSRLYPALFSKAENHVAVIRALASKWRGLTRLEIIQMTKLSEGGGTTRILEELEQSGFISEYIPFGKKKKEKIYRLTDEYSLFYLQFIDQKVHRESRVWEKLSQTQAWKSWSGFAFESICLKHVPQIKKALSIAGIYSEASSYYKKGNAEGEGVQIDLLLDRSDHVINLFEVKFYNGPYILSKDYALQLRKKSMLFQTYTKSVKQIFWSMITTFGVEENEHSIGLIDHSLTINDLFDN